MSRWICIIVENLLRGSVATDQDSRLSWNEHNRSAVKFEGEDDMDEDQDAVSTFISGRPPVKDTRYTLTTYPTINRILAH